MVTIVRSSNISSLIYSIFHIFYFSFRDHNCAHKYDYDDFIHCLFIQTRRMRSVTWKSRLLFNFDENPFFFLVRSFVVSPLKHRFGFWVLKQNVQPIICTREKRIKRWQTIELSSPGIFSVIDKFCVHVYGSY